MPAHTSSPPAYRAEAEFWADLLRLDNGKLDLWSSVSLGWGIEADVVLLEPSTGAFCIEVKALTVDQIRRLEIQSLIRKDGVACSSPFGQAVESQHALASALDKTWDDRPDLIPAAAFPLISRAQWIEQYQGESVGEFAHRCILKDDLVTLEALCSRLQEIALRPVGARPRSSRFTGLQDSVAETMHEALLGRTRPPQDEDEEESATFESAVLPMLSETIGLVKGPGAAYGSPGAESLQLWQAALSHVSERLRVSFVGEFKSGKSSLINAILGREVCYVDEFEATTISAVYHDGRVEEVRVELIDDSEERWTIQEFLGHCAAKELETVRSISVSLPTGLPFDIVDSPGLGTRTGGHTGEAELEIRRTDLLLWTVDANDAGSAREGAFIQRARQVGLPILVVLTKTDQLEDDEIESLIEYVANETGVPRRDVVPVSAHDHLAGKSKEVAALVKRLVAASERKAEVKSEAHAAKLRESIDGSISTLRFLIEINAPNARFLAAERGYLETSALGIGTAAKSEWLRVLREECAQVASSIASKSIDDPDVVELMLRKALPAAVNRATSQFLQSLRRLVRDEWRSALEQRSRELESRLSELLISRPDAQADLDFLRSESDAFRLRAEVIAAESDPINIDNRLLIVGLGAAASVITVSILPIALAGVVAAVAIRQRKGGPESGVDPIIASHIEDALIAGFDKVADSFERAIDRIVTEVAQRSLVNLVNRRGGPDYQTILVIERKCCDLMDELAAVRKC